MKLLNTIATVGLLALGLAFAPMSQAQAAHSVTLTWSPGSDATSATAYNIFRGSTSGGESATPLNASPVATGCTGATCTFTDTTVTSATKYFYYAEAVLNGASSIPSNEVSVTVGVDAPVLNPATSK